MPLAADGFIIRAPAGASLLNPGWAGADFEQHTVQFEGRTLVGVYTDGEATFRSVRIGGDLSPETDNPRTLSAPVAGVLRPIEYLWRTGCHWPRYVHVWAEADDTATTPLAAAVAASARPSRACPSPIVRRE